ncbi:MAG: RDD family protein [Vulcanimicrobiaceae bacterium]
MDRTVAIHTPESVSLSYELAGLGSRFIAVILDLLFQVVLGALVVWGLAALGSHAPKTTPLASQENLVASLAIAIIVFLLFAIFFGYFILFEAVWNGQTPGKRLAGIRVVRDGGYPIDFMNSLIRNFVRVLEFGLGFYLISAISALLSAENKRLGDYAAGTIVVRDSAIAAPQFPKGPLSSALALSDEERALIERYLERRSQLLPQRRAELSQRIADAIRAKAGPEFAALDDEAVIENARARFAPISF